LPDPDAEADGGGGSLGSSGVSPAESGDEGVAQATKAMRQKKIRKQDSTSSTHEPLQLANLLQVIDKNSQNAVNSAAKELRRNYGKKVADKLCYLTKTSLKILSKHFASASSDTKPEDVDESVNSIVFVLTAYLSIPDIEVRPSIDEVQSALVQAGKNILSVSKGVATWRKSVKKPRPGSKRITENGFIPNCDSNREMKLYSAKKEEKPVITEKPSNFYKSVSESKEVSKMYSMLSGCMQGVKMEFTVFSKIWDAYRHVWEIDREDTISVFIKRKPQLKDFENELHKYKMAKSQLTTEEPEYRYGSIMIDCHNLKETIDMEVKQWISVYGKAMQIKYKREMDFIVAQVFDFDRKLDRPINDLDDIRIIMETQKKIRDQEIDMDMKIDLVEEAFSLLSKYEIQLTKEEVDKVESLEFNWLQLQGKAMDVQILLLTVQEHFQKELIANLEIFQDDCTNFVSEYHGNGPMQPGLTPREASDRLQMFQNHFDALWRKHSSYTIGEDLFGLPHSEQPELNKIKKELNLLQRLYKLYNDVIDSVNNYHNIPWAEVNIEDINNELLEFQNRCRKLPKALKEWPAFHALKKTIDDFNDICPLLELMSNKAMKYRHWQKIQQITGFTFDLERPGFCLKDILEAPLLPNKEDIEDVCISALKEKDIEAKLRQVTNEWSTQELSFMIFKNRGELLLRGDTTAEIVGQVEDSLMVLGSLLSNRYNAPFRKQIQKWVQDLSNTNEILERWLLVQNMWVYLEAVFVGGDIAKQLPKEAKRFYKIDKSWQKIMMRAHETPGVVNCCVGDEFLRQTLPHLQEQLELCQKSLTGYLEKKRLMFPRFFFVSDPALLEILGQASDSHTIQAHLLSIFDNTANVKFHDQDYNKILTIVSGEGEIVHLERPVRAEGSVEVWLMSLLMASQESIHCIIRQAFHFINDNQFDMLEFLGRYQAQVGILGIQMVWTRDSESALVQSRSDRKIMQETNNKFLDVLNTLISQTTKNLDKMERTKFETLITVHMHQRDIFDMLVRLNVRSVQDFEWLKQSRFYFKQDMEKTMISITDVNFYYQNEYLGCQERLVITPLTDRCYITLAQALGMCMGGSPAGPAGTGKTETVKDMGKSLGKYVVVFNCSDQMDYRGLGRIFKGLAQSGSWGCFDEFNRITLPVLSVAAQQVAVVLCCKKEKRKTFIFTDGDMVEMNPEYGIFLTMNPTYSGRQELPENLKIQFRNVAMMVPDRQIIIRVKLASCGFLENITLARKFFTLYKLCEEQLTKQVHYDFGLRNILSVLRTLGSTKRDNPKDSEATIVMRVLRDMNLSKLVDEDEPLFISLVNDLFPNMSLEKIGYPDLEAAISEKIEEAELVNHPPWTIKIIQLYETQRVRHGIMVLGPSGAGKTECIQMLMKGLSITTEPHREMRLNPKAITSGQMFGRLDVATNDWTDGIFSALWRKTLKAKKNEHIWLVLDGPVDPMWIENLNSVLDDNKTLTLANGDRLAMMANCKLIFEPQNVDNASPATVSRNGMVYMSSSALDWSPLFASWAKKKKVRAEDAAKVRRLFEDYFNETYKWCATTLNMVMDIIQVNIVQQILAMLEGLLPSMQEVDDESKIVIPEKKVEKRYQYNNDSDDDEENDKPAKKEDLKAVEVEDTDCTNHEQIFIFCLLWSFGAFLENVDRSKFESYLVKHTKLAVPKFGDGDSIFNYNVNVHTGKWSHWNNLIQDYIPPEITPHIYSSLLIPNVSSIRTEFLINLVVKNEYAVLLMGEQGSAKTTMINAHIKNYTADTHMVMQSTFSSTTTPQLFQKSVESNVDKRMGTTYGPPAGKKLIIFIDDVNLPSFNEWGDQVTNELLRQLIEMRGFYSLEKPGDFNGIVDVHFLAAMIQPGGGRNDIPQRLKRHFIIYNCTLPTNDAIDRIFSTIAKGHYNEARQFPEEIALLAIKLVPLTRVLWYTTKTKMMPTPAKFHYVFNLRDLSRIWLGMIGTIPTVVNHEAVLMHLWRHECTRVLADRFITEADKEWFDIELMNTVFKEMGEEYAEIIREPRYFVDFMRDAPEPTGEEVEDTDMELPKIYEPIESFKALEERLKYFLDQYNEIIRGSDMDLVFFPDAVIHLIKISRVIRNPGGNLMLVGVGGSGKQSLTKLATFIAGYKTFQVTMTRSYNVANFLEDLKVLYRNCGIQGKGTTFLFTDQDIKEEGFLEYVNNILASGLVSNLFTRDEQGEIITELIPIMKRECPKIPPTPENVMQFFIDRVKNNLHVVLCFSPVGEKFRNRALKFPGLISGCTIDWFQPWPKDALVAVATHFLGEHDFQCSTDTRRQLFKTMAQVQDSVSLACTNYFQKYRRSAHVTPKSFLSFINSYKEVYIRKEEDIGDMAQRMNSGLSKLEEASQSVELLKEELNVMEKHLRKANKKAEEVLQEVTKSAKESEKIKESVTKVKDKAEKIVAQIGVEKAIAEEKLEAAKPALEEAEEALNTIKPANIATVRKLGRPPHLIMRVMDCVMICFRRKLCLTMPDPTVPSPKPSWAEALKMMASTSFLSQLIHFPKDTINDEMVELLEPYLTMEDYNMTTAKRVCGDVAGLLCWTKAMAFFFGVNKEVLPLKINLAFQEARLKSANNDLHRAQTTLVQKEEELAHVKKLYCSAVKEKQKLTTEAEICRRKMSAASTLINGLSGEKMRWTMQSKSFKEHMVRLVGDVLLACGFLSYAGPFNQEFRQSLLQNWKGLLKNRNIPYTNSINVVNMLVDTIETSEWALQGLPNDELSLQNAAIVTKAQSYPLLIDPQGQGKIWVKTKEQYNDLQVTSLNHKYFRTHLEDSLSLGRPLLIEDVGEELDPILDNLLDKNFIKQGSIMKVMLGDKEMDILDGFILFITTKLPNPAYTPEISARCAIIDFTVTMKGLEDQLLGRVIRMEKSDLETERLRLVEDVLEHKSTMKELEDNLLEKLNSVEGSLVEDEELINVLQETKTTAEEVSKKLIVASETESKINTAREEYRPVATRGSILYFLIVELSKVNTMYQTSLRQFLLLFDGSIIKSKPTHIIEKRINNVLEHITKIVWRYTLRGLYEKHKFLFTLLLALKIDLHSIRITHAEFLLLLKGGAALDLNAVKPKPFRWMLDVIWLNLVELSKQETFNQVLEKVSDNEKEWKYWCDTEAPEEEEIPCGYQSNLDVFRKLLLIRAWCPDRTLSQARKYIFDSLGAEYLESSVLDLETMLEESDNRIPLICLLSTGSDPSPQIEAIAKSRCQEMHQLSMGQGQEEAARKMMTVCLF
jgi:dynein heavy chain